MGASYLPYHKSCINVSRQASACSPALYYTLTRLSLNVCVHVCARVFTRARADPRFSLAWLSGVAQIRGAHLHLQTQVAAELQEGAARAFGGNSPRGVLQTPALK